MVLGLIVLFGWIALPLFMLSIIRRGLTAPITPTISLEQPPKSLFRRSRRAVLRLGAEPEPSTARMPIEDAGLVNF